MILIQENALENALREMAPILSRPQCVNGLHDSGHVCFVVVVCRTILPIDFGITPFAPSCSASGTTLKIRINNP